MTEIVLISDTHGRHDDVDLPSDGDVLLHAGDVTHRGRREEVEDFADWWSLRRYDDRFVVGGNHDRWIEEHPDRTREMLGADTYLQDDCAEAEGLTIWGSPWTPRFFDWSFMLPRGERLAEKWRQIPDDADIVVTHGPPKGILDRTNTGADAGSETLLDRIREVAPALHVFGHIHEARGRLDRHGVTFVNASCPDGEAPFVVDL